MSSPWTRARVPAAVVNPARTGPAIWLRSSSTRWNQPPSSPAGCSPAWAKRSAMYWTVFSSPGVLGARPSNASEASTRRLSARLAAWMSPPGTAPGCPAAEPSPAPEHAAQHSASSKAHTAGLIGMTASDGGESLNISPPNDGRRPGTGAGPRGFPAISDPFPAPVQPGLRPRPGRPEAAGRPPTSDPGLSLSIIPTQLWPASHAPLG